jgi:hypothetical protein
MGYYYIVENSDITILSCSEESLEDDHKYDPSSFSYRKYWFYFSLLFGPRIESNLIFEAVIYDVMVIIS